MPDTRKVKANALVSAADDPGPDAGAPHPADGPSGQDPAPAPLEERRFGEEVRLRDRELGLKERELSHRMEMEKRGARFHVSPLTTVLLGGVLTVLSSLATASWNARENRKSEEARAVRELALRARDQQFQIILKATENRSPEEATRNLLYFVDIGYLPDPEGRIRNQAKTGVAPVITSSGVLNPIEERIRDGGAVQPGPPTAPGGSAMAIRNHVLYGPDGQPVPVVASPNLSRLEVPRVLVVHFTANGSMEQAVRWFSGAEARNSAHVIIGRDGAVVQMIPFDYASWHAGQGRWKDAVVNLNRHSLGIDFVNWGQLQRRDGGWVAPDGRRIPDSEVEVRVDPRTGRQVGWQKFTEPQIRSAVRVAAALARTYPSIEAIVGHSELAVPQGRKIDPGPAFPIERVRREAFQGR
ncbi:MAG: N-acetylmuramoyl-L-alanine amidase [Gemmatimonadota bacterium]